MGESSATLARECEVFCRYLVGRSPAEYVSRKYAEAHSGTGSQPVRFSPANGFDTALLRIAANGPAWTSLADSYACIAARRSTLRKKLVLMVAILESCDATHGFRDGVDDTSAAAVVLSGTGRGLLFALRLLLAALLFAPMQLVLGSSGPPAATAGEKQ